MQRNVSRKECETLGTDSSQSSGFGQASSPSGCVQAGNATLQVQEAGKPYSLKMGKSRMT